MIISDLDPDGQEIAASFARSMRDDFGIDRVHPIKVAITEEQISRFDLTPQMTAKESSSQHGKFIAKHGTDVFECEALKPAQLQQVLTEAIDRVIDVETFNKELDAEKADSRYIAAARSRVFETLSSEIHE